MTGPRLACSALLILVTASAARATVLVSADLAELVASATVVVHGRVVATAPQWREGRRGIETVVTLQAGEYYKGGLGDEVSFVVPGGQMGPYRSLMVGAPTFTEGDDVIVFLRANGPALPYLVGFTQGVFRVVADRITRSPEQGAPPESRLLAAFAARVRLLARAGGQP